MKPTLEEMANEIQELYLVVCGITEFIHDGMDWQREQSITQLNNQLMKVGETLAEHRGMK